MEVRFNKEIEEALLGACIDSKEVFGRLIDKGVTKWDFYTTTNRKIFILISDCYEKNRTTDLMVLCNMAKDYDLTVSEISNMLGSKNFDIDALINELLKMRLVRERLRMAKDIETGNLKTNEDIEKRLNGILGIQAKIGHTNTLTTLDKVEIVDIYKSPKIPTGFRDIDNKILGFALGSLNIITGYNGNGKSTLVNQMCIAESLARGYKVFAYSPELTNSNLKSWLYPTIADEEHFTMCEWNGEKYKKVSDLGRNCIDKWIKDKLYIYTDDSITHEEKQLLTDMKFLAEEKGVRVFIIDNLMKIELEGSYKNELIAQRHFVNRLKEFARRYGAVVHLIAHPRKPQEGGKKITKFDIAGSGDITNLADYVMAISRITGEEKDEDPTLKDTFIKVMKDRIKGTGEFGVDYNFDTTRRRFYNNGFELNRRYGYYNDKDPIEVELELPF